MARSGGRGSGGADRFQQMAQQRDAYTQKLIDALDKLTGAVGQIGSSGASGVGGQAGIAAITANVASSPSAPTGSGGKSDSASGLGGGLGVSAVQQALRSSGASMPAALLGGIAGPGAAVGAAGLLAGTVIKDSFSSARAYNETYFANLTNDSPWRSNAYQSARSARAANVAGIKAEDTTTAEVEAYWKGFGGQRGQQGINAFRSDVAYRARWAQADLDEFEGVEEDAERRTMRFFGPLMDAGVRPDKGSITEVAKLFMAQAEASFAGRADIQHVVSGLNAARAGQQGIQNRHN